MSFRTLAAAVALSAAAFAQSFDVEIFAAARPDADTAAGAPFAALWRIDSGSGATTAVVGLPESLLGRAGGAYVLGSGISALALDERDGVFFAGTSAAAAGDVYGLWSFALAADGQTVVDVAALATWTASAAGEEVVEIDVLPNGDALALRSRSAAAGGFSGLDRVLRAGGVVPWPVAGIDGYRAAGLAHDPVDLGGLGAAWFVVEGPVGFENVVFRVVDGGGPAEFMIGFSTGAQYPGANGRPTSLTLCPTGNLIVTHDDAAIGVTAVNRTLLTAVVGWPFGWSTGHVALELDLVRDADVLLGDGAGAPGREVRRLLVAEQGATETLTTLPSGRGTAVVTSSGARMYGRAGAPPNEGYPRFRLLGTAHVGNPSFGLRCGGGEPNGQGFLSLGLAPTVFPLMPYGLPGTLWTVPELLGLPFQWDAEGRVAIPLPLPVGVPAGLVLYAQFLDVTGNAVSAGARLVTL